MAVSGNGQSDPSLKQEGRRWDLIATSERAAGICLAKSSWKSSVELWKQAENLSEGSGERWWEIPLGEGLWGEIAAYRSHSSGKVGFSLLFSNRVATKVVTPRGGFSEPWGIIPMFCWPQILVSRHLTAWGSADQWLIYSFALSSRCQDRMF